MAVPPTSPTPAPSPAPRRAPGDPYCANCGYSLKGLTSTPNCPECGRPLVEVLVRERAAFRSIRFRTEATLFGLPLIHIAMGPGPEAGQMRGHARGIIAIGDTAVGGIAIGGVSAGVVSIGGCTAGVVSIGGLSLGLGAAAGGLAIGGFAAGGGAIGVIASGGGAAGFVAQGGGAFGYYADGGGAWGVHVINMRSSDPQAKEVFDALEPVLGSLRGFSASWRPMLVPVGAALVLSVLILMVVIVAHRAWVQRAKSESARTGPGTTGGAGGAR